MPHRGACEPAAVCAARRSLQLAKERLQQLEARDAETWPAYCALRTEVAELERKRALAVRAVGAIEAREPQRVPTGDLVADARAAKAFAERRAVDLEQARAAAAEVRSVLEERRARFVKLDAERRALGAALTEARRAVEATRRDLGVRVLGEALEPARAALDELRAQFSPGELAGLIAQALESPAPPPAAA